MNDLPLIRSHERMDYKRCPKRWFWKWRMGLVPRAKSFGALELGTWVHEAFADWYSGERDRNLREIFSSIAVEAVVSAGATGIPDYELDKAAELGALGEEMMGAYQKRYGDDPGVNVIAAEVPLEFEITNPAGKLIAVHKLKPDLIYSDDADDVWLMEHKTAAQIRTGHLVIDDQARPYVSMSELALRKAGLLAKGQRFKGVMYNFARKALPDERPVNEKGQALNKNGTVSRRQPSPTFVRFPVTLTSAAKRVTLLRLRDEAWEITALTLMLRTGRADPARLNKTPHSSCEKTCPFFAMCVVEEQGGDHESMRRNLFIRQNPYTYDEEHPTTDIPPSFELS